MNPPFPSPSRMVRVLPVVGQPFATAKSGIPSPLKSPTTTETGHEPVAGEGAAVKVPSPFPSRMDRLPGPAPDVIATAMSSFPSPLKSATAKASGYTPTLIFAELRSTVDSGMLIGKKTTFDVPPPGPGLTTVTELVPAVAMSAASMVAFSCDVLAKVVARALPFHFTTEPETKPVPFTVRVNVGPPGADASGTRGWLTRGTGFWAQTIALNPIAHENASTIIVPLRTFQLDDCLFESIVSLLSTCMSVPLGLLIRGSRLINHGLVEPYFAVNGVHPLVAARTDLQRRCGLIANMKQRVAAAPRQELHLHICLSPVNPEA